MDTIGKRLALPDTPEGKLQDHLIGSAKVHIRAKVALTPNYTEILNLEVLLKFNFQSLQAK